MKSMQKFVAALLGTALCAVLLATAAFAQGGVAVILPVSIRTAGADPEPNAAYTLCLQAVDNAPMPDGAQNGQYSVTVQGAGDYTFPQITYTAPGIDRFGNGFEFIGGVLLLPTLRILPALCFLNIQIAEQQC